MSSSKITAFPLSWPESWRRTAVHKAGTPYKLSFWQAYEHVIAELRRFKAFGIVVSTDVPLRRDGQPYADGDPRDPGVAVYFTRGKQQYVLACDQWERVRFNMRAIGLALEGLRAVERSGAAHILDRAFAGFAALPSGAASAAAYAPTARPWREVLNLVGLQGPDFAVRAAVEASYKTLSRDRHPDAGGTHEAMLELNAAREQALKEITGA